MSVAPSPRQFFSTGSLPGAGLPHDRASRIAARRAFVELKQVFMEAAATLDGTSGEWLCNQIRHAEEPSELWLLRAPLMAALSRRDDASMRWRDKLRRSLVTLFPDTEVITGFGAFAAA